MPTALRRPCASRPPEVPYSWPKLPPSRCGSDPATLVAAGDGRTAAGHLLRWAARQQCPRPAEFTADVEALFQRQCNIRSEAGIDLDAVMKGILSLARKHEASRSSGAAALPGARWERAWQTMA